MYLQKSNFNKDGIIKAVKKILNKEIDIIDDYGDRTTFDYSNAREMVKLYPVEDLFDILYDKWRDCLPGAFEKDLDFNKLTFWVYEGLKDPARYAIVRYSDMLLSESDELKNGILFLSNLDKGVDGSMCYYTEDMNLFIPIEKTNSSYIPSTYKVKDAIMWLLYFAMHTPVQSASRLLWTIYDSAVYEHNSIITMINIHNALKANIFDLNTKISIIDTNKGKIYKIDSCPMWLQDVERNAIIFRQGV